MRSTKEIFIQYLVGKNLSRRTLKEYIRYYKAFNDGLKDQEFDQTYINYFLSKYKHCNPVKAFISNFIDCFDLPLKVPKVTGRTPRKIRRSISPQEIEVLRSWLWNNKNHRYLLCFDLTYSCALRKSEVMSIKVKDFDLDEWIDDETQSCRLLIHGKGNIERHVPVPSKVMQRLHDYMNKLQKDQEDRLFAFDKDYWQKAFKSAVDNSGIKHKYTLHDLRRTKATKWLMSGIDLIRVRDRLGHSSTNTTQLYINLEKEKEFDAWAKE